MVAAESEPTFEICLMDWCVRNKPRINLTACFTVKESFWISRYKI